MMEFKGPLKLYVDGVEMCEVTDVTFDLGEPGGDHTVEVDIDVSPDEETLFLALAMFRRRMRPDAERLGEGRDDGVENVLGLMWRRAQSGVQPMRWTCRECGLRVEDGPSRDGTPDSHTHLTRSGGRCGPLLLDPLDPALRKVYEECLAEANLVVRECEDLTMADYPGTLSTWAIERGDPVHQCTPVSQLPDDSEDDEDETDGPVAKRFYEASVTSLIPSKAFEDFRDALVKAGKPGTLVHPELQDPGSAPKEAFERLALTGLAPNDRVPGVYFETSFGVGPKPADPGLGLDLQERLKVVQYLRREESELRALAAMSKDELASKQMRRTADSLGGRASAIQMGEHVTPPPGHRPAATDDMVDAFVASMMSHVPTLETATGPELDRIAKLLGLPKQPVVADCMYCGGDHSSQGCPGRDVAKLAGHRLRGDQPLPRTTFDELRDREAARKKADHADQMAQLRALHRDKAQVAELEKLAWPAPHLDGSPWVVAYDAAGNALLTAPMSPDGKAVFPPADRAMVVDHVAIHVAGLVLPVEYGQTQARQLSPGHVLDLLLDADGLRAARQHVFGL